MRNICFTIAYALIAATLAPVSLARAQDLNFQQEFETLAPDSGERDPPAPQSQEVTQFETRVVRKSVPVKLTPKEMEHELKNSGVAIAAFTSLSPAQLEQALLDKGKKTTRTIIRTETTHVPVKKIAPPRPQTTWTFNSQANDTYRTNINSAPDSTIDDWVLVASPRLTWRYQFDKTNSLTAFVQSTFTRFAENDVKDNDNIIGRVAYTYTFNESIFDSTLARGGYKPSESWGIRFQERSAFQKGFRGKARNIYTPAVYWTLSNIPLSEQKCKNAACLSATLTATFDYSWLNSKGQDNASAGVETALTWTEPSNRFLLELTPSIRGRDYERAAGNRRDVALGIGVQLAWQPRGNDSLKFAAGVSYTDQESTLDPAAYRNFDATPSVSVKMQLN